MQYISKLFVIWFALVHVALRFMLWFCWYLNWKKKNIARFTVSVYFFPYTYILCEMRIFTFARAFRVRAHTLCMRPWDSVDWTKTKTKRTIFVDLFFFFVYNQNNAETAKRTLSPICIDNDALTLSQRSHTSYQHLFANLVLIIKCAFCW